MGGGFVLGRRRGVGGAGGGDGRRSRKRGGWQGLR